MWFSRYQPNRARWALTAALAAGVAIITVPRSSAGATEAWNFVAPIPHGNWNGFEVQFCGNMEANIQLGTSDANTNPFQGGYMATTNNPTPTRQCPNGVTTATFAGAMGTQGIRTTWAPFNTAADTNGMLAHFGILNNPTSSSTWLQAEAADWTNSVIKSLGPVSGLPSIVPTWTPPTGSGGYIIAYLQDTDDVGQWLELPYTTGPTGSLMLTLSNNDSTPLTFNDYGYFLSPTFIPLDNLNFTGEPPPGHPNSPFTVLPTPPSLSAGGSEVVAATPEPSELGLLVLGGLALLARRRWLRAG